MKPATESAGLPENPVVCRVWRGEHIESQHRGAWVLVDGEGAILDSVGGVDNPIFARSAIKSLQALPLIETGAADRFGLGAAELALCVSSHNAEACHTDGVAELLHMSGGRVEELGCGTQPPGDRRARAALALAGAEPTALHNNCSGKHAGFLALARHLEVAPGAYLDPTGAVQELIRRSVAEMCGVEDRLERAVDGCSAPTYRLPLASMARGIARLATPEGLHSERREACHRLTDAVAEHPVLLAGSHRRICTDLVRTSRGRLFPKVGAEAVYLVGVRGEDRGLAVKIDDGGMRALHALVVSLLERFGFLGSAELAELDSWRGLALTNWAGLEVGRLEVIS